MNKSINIRKVVLPALTVLTAFVYNETHIIYETKKYNELLVKYPHQLTFKRIKRDGFMFPYDQFSHGPTIIFSGERQSIISKEDYDIWYKNGKKYMQ